MSVKVQQLDGARISCRWEPERVLLQLVAEAKTREVQVVQQQETLGSIRIPSPLYFLIKGLSFQGTSSWFYYFTLFLHSLFLRLIFITSCYSFSFFPSFCR